MSKKLFLLFFGLCTAVLARSQQLSPSVLAADGGISKAAGISLEWTLGEIAAESIFTVDRLYTQGFHQPVLIAKNVQTDAKLLVTGYHVSVAPNPVQSVLTATVSSPIEGNVYLSLIDFSGRRYPAQLMDGKSGTAQVNMSGMISGMYLLEIRNGAGQLIKAFKIIKGQ